MSVMLRDKVDQQNRLWNRMQEIQRVAEDEKRDWTAEERTNWDAANEEITTVSADIERLERMANLGSVDYGQARQGSGADTPTDDAPEDRAAAYEAAFSQFTRAGLDRLTGEQRQLMLANAVDERAVGAGQVVATTTLGGYLVPPGYRAVLTEALKAYGGMLNLANVITTSTGNPLQWPTNDDTGNVGAILEEANVVPQQNVVFGTKTLGAYMYTSKLVLVSYQLLQDSAFDLDNWLPGKLGERIGRALAAHFITGTGVAQPEGILTNATSGATAATNATITYDNIIDLEHSVDPAYRASGNCRFVFNDATLALLRKLKDSQQRPLWVPIPVPGMAATINGLPYTIDQAMPNVATIAKSVLFGDFKAGFLIRQVLDVQMARLAERYADFLQVGFFGFARYDSEPDAPGAVRCLTHPV